MAIFEIGDFAKLGYFFKCVGSKIYIKGGQNEYVAYYEKCFVELSEQISHPPKQILFLTESS